MWKNRLKSLKGTFSASQNVGKIQKKRNNEEIRQQKIKMDILKPHLSIIIQNTNNFN